MLLAPLLADRDEDGARFKGRICEEERRRWCVELLAGFSEEDENDSGMDERRRAEKRASGPISHVQVSNRAILALELAGGFGEVGFVVVEASVATTHLFLR